MNNEINISDKERFDLYMSLEKEQVVKLLIESNRLVEALANRNRLNSLSTAYSTNTFNQFAPTDRTPNIADARPKTY